jgi:hypothetical protein
LIFSGTWRNPAASSVEKMRRECPPLYGGDECKTKNLFGVSGPVLSAPAQIMNGLLFRWRCVIYALPATSRFMPCPGKRLEFFLSVSNVPPQSERPAL